MRGTIERIWPIDMQTEMNRQRDNLSFDKIRLFDFENIENKNFLKSSLTGQSTSVTSTATATRNT